ncbi:uncharacterized protein LOC135388516 [Ornithodoros turicata]|uniref:uncharacterized protein LOC135388516 n=1 Tax=Ornithodoros turicata TaxID=34597 RepID=UPI003139321F
MSMEFANSRESIVDQQPQSMKSPEFLMGYPPIAKKLLIAVGLLSVISLSLLVATVVLALKVQGCEPAVVTEATAATAATESPGTFTSSARSTASDSEAMSTPISGGTTTTANEALSTSPEVSAPTGTTQP